MPGHQSGDLWTADQAASHRGISTSDWLRDVYTGREPLPAVKRQTDESGDLWDAETVRKWRHHGELQEGEWLAAKCAQHHGLTTQRWGYLVRVKHAPQPKRTVQRHHVWDADEVRRYRPDTYEEARQDRSAPAPGQWTARQSAEFLGVTVDVWRSAVRDGRAPRPIGKAGQSNVWEEQAVRSRKYPLAQSIDAPKPPKEPKRPDKPRSGEWTAAQCAAFVGMTVSGWHRAVRDGRAPAAVRKIGNSRLWSQAEVVAMPVRQRRPSGGKWTAKECADHHGISPRAWRAAVRAGDAPEPVDYANAKTPLWDEYSVRALIL